MLVIHAPTYVYLIICARPPPDVLTHFVCQVKSIFKNLQIGFLFLGPELKQRGMGNWGGGQLLVPAFLLVGCPRMHLVDAGSNLVSKIKKLGRQEAWLAQLTKALVSRQPYHLHFVSSLNLLYGRTREHSRMFPGKILKKT